MSKVYEKYLKNKINDKDKIYIFRSGAFYIALCDDASFLNDKYGLKITYLNDEVFKCGFPINSINKYENMFKLDNISYEIVKDIDKDRDTIIKILENVNIDNITPLEAFDILKRVCDLL